MYNAFISYSHAADGKLAPALQTALEKFAKPWYKVRYLNVFRDEASLTASPHLWTNIQKALDQSEYLIYMASPMSASSKWIIKEIEYWLEYKSIETLLIVLTDGEIVWDDEHKTFFNKESNSLPDVLENKFTEEPFYIDLRTARTQEDVSLNNPIFKKEVLKLAAHLHGKQPKDLASEEVFAHRKMIIVRNTAIAILVFLLCIAIGAAWLANKNANEATFNLRKADSSAVIATQQRDSAIIARRSADENAHIAKLQKDTAQFEKENALKQEKIAIEQRNKAEANYLISESRSALSTDPTLALRLLEQASLKYDSPDIENELVKVYKENSFYKDRPYDYQGYLAISPSGTKGLYMIHPDFEWEGYSAEIRNVEKRDASGSFYENDILKSADFSPDGHKAIYNSETGIFVLMNDKGKFIKKLDMKIPKRKRGSLPQKSFKDFSSFSPDCKKILTISNGEIRLWDTMGNQLETQNFDGRITCAALSASRETIYLGLEDGTIQKWNWQGKKMGEFSGHNADIEYISFSPDHQTLLSCSTDSTSRLWDQNGRCIQILRGTAKMISAKFSSDGRLIVTSSTDGAVKLWNINATLLQTFINSAQGLAYFSNDGNSIVCGSKILIIKDIPFKERQTDTNWIISASCSKNAQTFLYKTLKGSASLWNLDGHLLKEFESPSGPAILSPDGQSVFTVYDEYFEKNDSTLREGRLLDLKGNLLQKFIIHSDRITSVAFSSDERLLVTGSNDGEVILWDLRGHILHKFPSQDDEISFLAFSADNTKVFIGSNEQPGPNPGGNLILFDLKGNIIKDYQLSSAWDVPSNIICFPDNDKILVLTTEGELTLMRLNGTLITRFDNGNKFPGYTCAALSNDFKKIIAGTSDGNVFIYDLNGKVIENFIGHSTDLVSAIFSIDNKIITTCDRDGNLKFWKIEPSVKEILKSNKIEVLSPEQKRRYKID